MSAGSGLSQQNSIDVNDSRHSSEDSLPMMHHHLHLMMKILKIKILKMKILLLKGAQVNFLVLYVVFQFLYLLKTRENSKGSHLFVTVM